MQLDTDIKAGDILENLLVTDLTVEGQGIARHHGRVVFLDQGLPGALLSATVRRIRKGVAHADVLRVLQPSPYEVSPWCPHFGECGACMWQHFAPSAALEWKRRHVRQCLARIGGLGELPVSPVFPSPRQQGFRNKMTYAFGEDHEGHLQLGLRRFKDHGLVEIRRCALQDAVGTEIVAFAREEARRLGLRAFILVEDKSLKGKRAGRGYLRFLIVRTPLMRTPEGGPQILVECISGTDHSAAAGGGRRNAEAVEMLGLSLCRRFGCAFVHSERGAGADVAQGERTVAVIGGDTFQERFGDLTLTVPYNAFLQTNTEAAQELYSLAVREAGLGEGEGLWDLYCGIGVAGFYVAPKARFVHGFEIRADAVEAARANAQLLGFFHCFFHAGDVDETLMNPDIPQPAVILADPPRAGLSESVRRCLLGSTARRFLYISCNAATQARDAAILAPRWKAVRSLPVDMFPHTPHVENLLVFDRRES